MINLVRECPVACRGARLFRARMWSDTPRRFSNGVYSVFGLLLGTAVFFPVFSAQATNFSSTSFIMKDPVIGKGAGFSASTSFQGYTAIGQPAIGISSSTNFIFKAGFLYFTTSTAATASSSSPSPSTSGGGGSFGAVPSPWPFLQPPSQASVSQPSSSVLQSSSSIPSALPPLASILNGITNFIERFLPHPLVSPKIAAPIVPEKTPVALRGLWELVSRKEMGAFVFAPLPQDIAMLKEKFPTVADMLKTVGVAHLSDLSKLKNVKLYLPNLTERIGIQPVMLKPQPFALPKGIPIANLLPEMKARIPSGIIFARIGGEKIDLPTNLSLRNDGSIEQSIRTVAGSMLHLVIKPEFPVKSVTGYLVLKSRMRREEIGARGRIPLQSMLASILFAPPIFAGPSKNVTIEQRFALIRFEYTDPDGDGIYTADIRAPAVDGEYDVITIISFKDSRLGMKEIGLTAVVDPEGYVFERNGDKETRVLGAVVSLSRLNSTTGKYELWPGRDYTQKNPQVTDVRGTYAFLVPPGTYSVSVTAPGYYDYSGKPFEVTQNDEVHTNIEMKPVYGFLEAIDYKTILLIVLFLLVGYNFYRDKLRV